MLSVAALAMAVACNKDENDPVVEETAEINEVSGIETTYELGQHEYLKISPVYKFTSDNLADIKYEWSINGTVVSTDSLLNYKMDNLGDAKGVLKVSDAKSAKLSKFNVIVTSPYDKGLLLLSETKDGAMLSWKRLDRMGTPVSLNSFKDNNPTLDLGSEACDLVWLGDRMTNYLKDTELDIYLATNNPTTVYSIDANTMTVKNSVECDFVPKGMLVPFGWDNLLYKGIVYFRDETGIEKAWSSDKVFVESDLYDEKLGGTPGQTIDISTSTIGDDWIICSYSKADQTFIYTSPLFGVSSSYVFNKDVEPMAMLSCDGSYREEESADYRYEPVHFIFVGTEGSSVKVYHMAPSEYTAGDEILHEIDASSYMDKTSAVAVNPVRPLLYCSKDNNIYVLNYDGGNFDSAPLITLPEGYVVKSMTMNIYDENTLYIAAEKPDEATGLPAGIFVYDITGNNADDVCCLFESEHAGGSVKKLIYKGNGRENLDRPRK